MANTAIIPLKAIRTGSQATGDVTALGEFESGDKIDGSYFSLSGVVTSADFNSALANTNSYIATTAATERSSLANTNAYIATKLDSRSYTESDVRSKSALANTNAYIATKLNTSSYTEADVRSKAALANTNAYIASVIDGQTFTGDVFVGTNKFGGDATDYLKYADNTQLDIYINDVNQFRFENDGDLHANGDIVAFSTTVSDERLKENIEIISNAADKVSRIKGVTFTRKGGDESAGIIAQDILNILPQAVKEKSLPLQTGTDDKYYVVEYDAVTGLLVQAVKELTERVQELEKKSL